MRVGATLNDRYRLEKKIGEGGYAQVYQATDLMLGRVVAVKLLDTDLGAQPDLLSRFQLEARAVAALDHPNILPIYDFGRLPDSGYLVMPYLPGGTLTTRLKQGRLTPQEACSYIEQIASALDYAHQSGILHRDVKPSNILLRADGRPVLADFGFAKIMPDAQVEASTQALGTVQYVAPEQIHNKVSAFTDQYSLGVVFYQLLSGVVPFTGVPQVIVMAHLNQRPPSLIQQPALAEVSPQILERLDAVIAQVMAKQPAQRFPTCLHFSQAAWRAVQPSQHPSVPLTPRPAVVAQPVSIAVAPPVAAPARPVPPAEDAEENAATQLFSGPVERGPAGPPKKLKPARLHVYTRPDQGFNFTFELRDDEISLGRDTQMKIQLPLATISRHHATLRRVTLPTGPAYKLVDNKSRNGLAYQGRFFNERILQDGDVIEIGRPGYGDYVVFLTYNAPSFE